MIYTGYYNRLKEYQEAGLVTCSISQGVYRFGKVDTDLNCFKPTWKMVKEGYTEEDYQKTNLKNLNPFELFDNLTKMFGKRDFILLCYEGNPEECHRSYVRRWLNGKGVLCEEYPVIKKQPTSKEPEKKIIPKQMFLF